MARRVGLVLGKEIAGHPSKSISCYKYCIIAGWSWQTKPQPPTTREGALEPAAAEWPTSPRFFHRLDIACRPTLGPGPSPRKDMRTCAEHDG